MTLYTYFTVIVNYNVNPIALFEIDMTILINRISLRWMVLREFQDGSRIK